jgi:hypothetical protein
MVGTVKGHDVAVFDCAFVLQAVQWGKAVDAFVCVAVVGWGLGGGCE